MHGARLHWARDGADWPHRAHSRFVHAGGLHWHVQVAGQGPVLLLLHGTGASSHSMAGLLPLLAERFTVVVPDLPGHAFTDALPGSASLPAMSRAL
ncbi:MAG: alpha/beta fold hydrolase, partial [Aquincola sp.]|nr:alpha/beta fold hydrolase [Aquincola sp.]